MDPSSATRGVNSTGECHLLVLPRELRDNILGHTLMFEEIHPTEVNLFSDDLEEFKQPPLSLVNKREETLSIYYGKKTFRINAGIVGDNTWELAKLWFTASKPHLQMIKKIEICLCADHEVVLDLQAAVGTQASYKVIQKPDDVGESEDEDEDESEEENEDCECFDVLEEVEGELQRLCHDVQLDGFGPEEYVRAGDLFFFPEDKRCAGYDDDEESEDDYDEERYWNSRDYDDDFLWGSNSEGSGGYDYDPEGDYSEGED